VRCFDDVKKERDERDLLHYQGGESRLERLCRFCFTLFGACVIAKGRRNRSTAWDIEREEGCIRCRSLPRQTRLAVSVQYVDCEDLGDQFLYFVFMYLAFSKCLESLLGLV
jgi:hypothetical protein